MIAAIDQNSALSKNGVIAWDIPEDRDFFRKTIAKQNLLVGRHTYNQMQGCYKDQDVYLLSQSQYKAPLHYNRTYPFIELHEALSTAEENDVEKLFVIGGASIYDQTIELADELYITEVACTISGDRFFPKIDETSWQVFSRETQLSASQNEKDTHSFSFVHYTRRAN